MKTRILLIVLAALSATYFLGPSPEEPSYPDELPIVAFEGAEVEAFIARKEKQHNLKPGTNAKIIWAHDSAKSKTAFSLVYLHGFSASHHEGYPLHVNLAEKYGCNLYLARLYQHGIDTTDALFDFTAEGFYKSALEALAIGEQIGEKVILLSTSTGCTAALKLAADFPEVHALVNLSPNVRINDPFAFLLNNPWGGEIAKIAMGGEYRYIDGGPEYAKYWNDKYRTESLVQLQELIETTMVSETFNRVDQPVFNGYYYASEAEQDPVVKVSAILWMHDLLTTPDSLKVARAFPKAENHVLASPIKSSDVEGVESAVSDFLSNVVGMKPVAPNRKNN